MDVDIDADHDVPHFVQAWHLSVRRPIIPLDSTIHHEAIYPHAIVELRETPSSEYASAVPYSCVYWESTILGKCAATEDLPSAGRTPPPPETRPMDSNSDSEDRFDGGADWLNDPPALTAEFKTAEKNSFILAASNGIDLRAPYLRELLDSIGKQPSVSFRADNEGPTCPGPFRLGRVAWEHLIHLNSLYIWPNSLVN